MNDLISRDDAVAIVLMCSRIYNLSEQEKWNKCVKTINSLLLTDAVPCEVADKVGEENERLTDRIGQLEEQMRWVPVSERLPNDGDDVICTDKNGDIRHCRFHRNIYRRKYTFLTLEEGRTIIVIAWKPLPKPYREDGE